MRRLIYLHNLKIFNHFLGQQALGQLYRILRTPKNRGCAVKF